MGSDRQRIDKGDVGSLEETLGPNDPPFSPADNQSGTPRAALLAEITEAVAWSRSWSRDEFAMQNARTLHYDMAGRFEPLLERVAAALKSAWDDAAEWELECVEARQGAALLEEERNACGADLAALRQDRERLAEAVTKLVEHEWLITSDYNLEVKGEEWHWRVAVRDEPSKSEGSTTFTNTAHRGRTPVDAALAALAARQAGRTEEGEE